jgi:hypothetical protein
MTDNKTVTTTALEKIWERRDGTLEWLEENHPEVFKEQKHLDDGSVERAYWHYGYAVALTDMKKLIESRKGQTLQ